MMTPHPPKSRPMKVIMELTWVKAIVPGEVPMRNLGTKMGTMG